MYMGLAAAWLVIVTYVATLVARERKLRDEIARLKQMVDGGDRAR